MAFSRSFLQGEKEENKEYGLMSDFLHTAYWKFISAFLYAYYRSKTFLMRPLVGEDALAYVLYDSLFPIKVLKLGGARIGDGVRIGRWMTIHESRGSFKNLEIGDDCWIGKHVLIDLSDKVKLGNRSGLGMYAIVITHENLGRSKLAQGHPATTAPVEIMEDAYVSWGCVVNKGTTVLPRAIVLPGATISGTIGEGAKYGGNPARLVPVMK
jgi:acetyltransferase-like isoleucine patch superfamily enzyme